MLNLRWLAIAALVLGAGVAGLWLSSSPPPSPALPRLLVPDAGRFALSAPRSTFTVGGAPFPSAIVTPTIGRACVTGKVVDAATGAGLPGAQVTLTTFAGSVMATTDASGRFEHRGLTEGVVSIGAVTADGYFALRAGRRRAPLEFRLVEGLCVADLSLSLAPRVEYQGEVIGPSGEAVPGARVTVATEREAPAAPLPTDAHGRFRFHAADGALVAATHPDFAPGVAVVDFRVTTTRRLTVALGPRLNDAGATLVSLRGVVVDEADAGVTAALVHVARAFSTKSGRWERLEATVETTAEGAFTVEVEAPGPWLVGAYASGQASTVQETSGEPVVLRLSRGATLTGAVSDDEGRAVTAFSVLLARPRGPLEREPLEPRHVVDVEGRFTVSALPPGALEVVVVAPGLAPSKPVGVELEAGSSRHVDVHLGRGAQLSGTVVDRASQRPLEGARVSLEQRGDDPTLAQPLARTDERGGFTLQGLPPGRHSLFVVAAAHDARLLSVDLNVNAAAGPLLIDLAPVADGGTPQLELIGIGAVLKAVGDGLVIERTLEGGGAAQAGLVAGDVMLRVDGLPTATLGFAGAIERIRGTQDTTVALEVRRASGAVEVVATPRRRVAR